MKRRHLIAKNFFIFLTWIFLAPGCEIKDNDIRENVIIGDQIWMTENLSVSHFRNGDPIPEARTNKEWITAGEEGQPAWSYYGNDPENGEKYGKLYNWHAVNDPRGLAPEGWRIPSHNDWEELINHLGGQLNAGGLLKSEHEWRENLYGVNETNFSAFPGGVRNVLGEFSMAGDYGFWWTSTEVGLTSAWSHSMVYYDIDVNMNSHLKNSGFSVRCMQDKE